MGESYKPPSSAVKAAKKGLAQRKEWGRGGLSPSEAKAQGIDSGVTRARKIASGSVSRHDVRRMSAFNRHRKNNRPDKKMPDGGPTAGTIAWNLWGGTSGVNWAKKKSAAMGAETFAAESDFYEWEWDRTDFAPTELIKKQLKNAGFSMTSGDYSYKDQIVEFYEPQLVAPNGVVLDVCLSQNEEFKGFSRLTFFEQDHSGDVGKTPDIDWNILHENGLLKGEDSVEQPQGDYYQVYWDGLYDEWKNGHNCADNAKFDIYEDNFIVMECVECGRTATFEQKTPYEGPRKSRTDKQMFGAEEEDEEELKQYSVTVPVLHYYGIGPVEAYDEDEAIDEVRNNWGHWRRTIENNGDWGGPLWRYSRLSSHDPEAYEILDSETLGAEELCDNCSGAGATIAGCTCGYMDYLKNAETISGDPWDEGSVADEVYKLLQTHGKIDYWSYRKDDGYLHFDIILDPLQTELGDFAAETLDYNSFTNDMEDLLLKYSQMLLHYDTEYQSKARGGDGVMKMSVSFIPSDAYFDDVDFDAEEGQLAKALAAVREKSKRYAPTPLRLTKLPHPDQKTLKDFEADWRDLSRDSSGRWLPAGDDSTVSYDMTDMSWMTPSEYYQYVLEEPLDISDDIEDDTQTIEFQDRFVRYTAMTMSPQVIDALIEENELEIVSNLFADSAEAEGEIAFLKAVKRYQQFSEQYSAE